MAEGIITFICAIYITTCIILYTYADITEAGKVGLVLIIGFLVIICAIANGGEA